MKNLQTTIYIICVVIISPVTSRTTGNLYSYQRLETNFTSVNLGEKTATECALACSYNSQCLGLKVDMGTCQALTQASPVDFCDADVAWAFMEADANYIISRQKLAMFGNRNADITIGTEPLSMDNFYMDIGSHFDGTTQTVRIPEDDYYFCGLAGHRGRFYLVNDNNYDMAAYWPIMAGQTAFHTRGFIKNYQTNDELSIRGNPCTSCQLKMMLFRLYPVIGCDPVVFSVQRDMPHGVSNPTIGMNRVVVDTGSRWSTDRYVIPRTGVYFISASSACMPTGNASVSMQVNNVPQSYIYCDNKDSPAFDPSLMGTSQMFNLNAGDEVTLAPVADYGNGYSTLVYPQTWMGGFLYEPKQHKPVAWSVRNSDPICNTGTYNIPLSMDTVLVNLGGAWANNKATCVQSGTYFVSFTARKCPNKPLHMRLTKDRIVNHPMTEQHAGDDMGSITSIALVDCDEGQTIWIESSAPTNSHRGDVIFTGFLLYAY